MKSPVMRLPLTEAKVDSPDATSDNRLYYGDNLSVMRDKFRKDSVDLIYLDPPFNSQRTYNLMYRRINGRPVPEQVEAFCDTWVLDDEKEAAARSMPILMREEGIDEYYIDFWRIWVGALRNTQPHLLAYLIYMVQRLLAMRSILRPTGSIYLHCDPTTSHYVKVMMDGIFGHANFRNEIIWKRTFAHSGATRWGDVHDTILFYSKSEHFTWNREVQSHDDDYVKTKYRHQDERGRYRLVVLTAPGIRKNGPSGRPWRGYDPSSIGRHWAVPRRALEHLAKEGIVIPRELHEQLELLLDHGLVRFTAGRNGGGGAPEAKHYLSEGQMIQDVITDIAPLNSQSKERLGYPTQKPIALLNRIIRASSNIGDTIFDPFCGCGTTVHAAATNGRRWIGCDIAILPIKIVQQTLQERHGMVEGVHYTVSGVPASIEQGIDLWRRDHVQFEHWFVEAVGGFPTGHGSRDRTADGRIYFETISGSGEVLLEVKRQAKPGDVRRLAQAVGAEPDAHLGALLVAEEPSRPVRSEVEAAGSVTIGASTFPRIQIVTLSDFFEKNQSVTVPSKAPSLNTARQPELPWA